MRVLYVSWGEVPRLSSVYGGQLVNVAAEMRAQDAVSWTGLLAGLPLIHSGLVREKWRFPAGLRKIERILGPGNFLRRYLPVPPVGVHPTRRELGLFNWFHTRRMAALIDELRPDVVHCRSYLATYAAHEWRARSRHDFAIVFDTRSDMPGEGLLKERWEPGSPDDLFWRATERRLLIESDAVTAVSQPLCDTFRARSEGKANVHLIHLNVSRPEGEVEQSLPPKMPEGPVFCYCGYLDSDGWHHPRNLWSLFDAIAQHRENAQLLVITRTPHDRLRSDLASSGFAHLADRVHFAQTDSPTQTVAMMRHCDVGLLSYFDPSTPEEHDVAKGVFATKTAEYLFAGLPVIINSVCEGAARFAVEHRVGISYDDPMNITAAQLNELIAMKDGSPDHIADVANDAFAITNNCGRLASIYADCIASRRDRGDKRK